MNNKLKGEGMIKELMEKVFKKKDKDEIEELVEQIILGECDDLNYSLEKNTGLTLDDAKALRELNNIRLDNSKAKAEVIEKVAKALGVTIGAAAAIVSAVLAIKYFKIDVEWLECLYNMKDSAIVPDKPTSSQATKFRDDHKKSVIGNLVKGIKVN